MRRFITLSLALLLLSAALFAQAQDTPSAELKEAVKLYFDFKQEAALNKFIEISKTTKEREAFLNAAYIALEQANSRLAVDTMAMALKLYPNDTTVLEFAGEAYLAAGFYANAENVFSRLSESNTKAEFYYINLARAQMGLGQDDLAETNLKQAARGQNHTALSNFLLGQLYQKKKDYKKAEDAYKKVIDYDSQFIEAKIRYADVLTKLKQYKEAWKVYASVNSVERNNAEVVSAMAQIRPKIKKEDQVPFTTLPPLTPQQHTHVKPVISYDGELPIIRVGLGAKISGAPIGMGNVKFSTSHPFNAVDREGKIISKGKPGSFWRAEVIQNKPHLVSPNGVKTPFTGSIRIEQQAGENAAPTTIIKDMITGHGMTWIYREDKEYRGVIEFLYSPKLNSFILVNHVNIEEYVFGVVASEMPSIFPVEALKSQAVIARTYGIKALGKHKQWGYDVCDTQNCQVYGGVKAERERTNAATEATMGMVLTYKNKPIEAVFSSNCGGFTQSSKEAGWYYNEYLQPVSDYHDFDSENLQPYHFKELLQHTRGAYSRYFKNVSPATFRWTRYIEEPQLRAVVKARKDIGEIQAIVPLKRGKSGYVNGIKIVGANGSLILSKENEIKKYLALGMLRSSYFIVEPKLENNVPKAFIFYGGGWGHGVGLCQTGTGGRADAGQNYEDILKHYYTGAILKDVRRK